MSIIENLNNAYYNVKKQIENLNKSKESSYGKNRDDNRNQYIKRIRNAKPKTLNFSERQKQIQQRRNR